MAITSITLDATMVGTIISPAPDGYVTRLMLTRSQQPPYQTENWIDLPYPRGRWTSGRFVLTDQGGSGQRVFNFSTQTGALVAGHVVMSGGQAFQYRGDLLLECCPASQAWEIQISDIPIVARAA
jgi:hypothetical protein